MAAPIAVAEPAEVHLRPGDTVPVQVTAYDPDSKSGTAIVPLTDQQGNVTTVTVTVVADDPITFGQPRIDQELTDIGIEVVVDSVTVGLYHFRWPA